LIGRQKLTHQSVLIRTPPIRVGETVKRKIDRRRRGGESYNDVLVRLFVEMETGSFDDGFGQWSDEATDRVREGR